jgi:phosphatidylserine decarboxylase
VVSVLPRQRLALEKGAELGRFNMGSTVILLFEAHRARWHAGVRAGTSVRLGQSLGTLE